MSKSRDQRVRRWQAMSRRSKQLQTDADREKRAVQRDIARQLSGWTPRRVGAWTLFVLALLVASQHLLAHLGWRPIPVSMGWQDLLIGYPAAGVLGVLGAICLEARSARR